MRELLSRVPLLVGLPEDVTGTGEESDENGPAESPQAVLGLLGRRGRGRGGGRGGERSGRDGVDGRRSDGERVRVKLRRDGRVGRGRLLDYVCGRPEAGREAAGGRSARCCRRGRDEGEDEDTAR